MSEQQRVERGAAEEASGTPVTETEVDASRRPPSEPDAARDGTTHDASPEGTR
jgi:hypothetical protein